MDMPEEKQSQEMQLIVPKGAQDYLKSAEEDKDNLNSIILTYNLALHGRSITVGGQEIPFSYEGLVALGIRAVETIKAYMGKVYDNKKSFLGMCGRKTFVKDCSKLSVLNAMRSVYKELKPFLDIAFKAVKTVRQNAYDGEKAVADKAKKNLDAWDKMGTQLYSI